MIPIEEKKTFQKRFGKFLSKKRKEKGFTQKQLAKELNITLSVIRCIENGVSIKCFDVAFLQPISSLLDFKIPTKLEEIPIIEDTKTKRNEEQNNQKVFRIKNGVLELLKQIKEETGHTMVSSIELAIKLYSRLLERQKEGYQITLSKKCEDNTEQIIKIELLF